MKTLPEALLIATMDTKGQEALFIRACLKEAKVSVCIMDAGIRGESPIPVEISRNEVAIAGGKDLKEVQSIGHEGKALEIMTRGAVNIARERFAQNKTMGVIGLGGSMGTTLGTAVMRSLPVGIPKVMISTMASRDTRAFVGTKDILMLHSVCDLAGLNRITRKVLRNGAMALAGMLTHSRFDENGGKPLVFVSTLGTTESCAQRIRKSLEAQGNEVVIFHTVGAGGKAMEEMLAHEKVAALVDLSLHEIADHQFGGDYDAGADRGKTAFRLGVPTLLVPGNIDFLVTGPLDTARQRFPGRPYHVHNAAITVVRTTQEEVEKVARVIADIGNGASGPMKILIPMGGLSAFDSPEGPLYDPEGPKRFAAALQEDLDKGVERNLLPYHINDRAFSDAVLSALKGWLRGNSSKTTGST